MKNKYFKIYHKNRIVLLFLLIAITLILSIIIIFRKDSSSERNFSAEYNHTVGNKLIITNPKTELDGYIDSVLFTFGIKKEWITTLTGDLQNTKAEWFYKTVLIPKDITTAEINLDITSVLTSAGLSSNVTEDILSKNITVRINNPDSSKQYPAAVIQVTHSEKVKRESGIIALIIDKVSEFSSDEVDKLFITKNEFSYIFPRSLDEIEIQHKLMQNKKDIVINLTMGGSENYEADFNLSMDDKAIGDRVRTFNADFGSINKVLLTKDKPESSLSRLQNKITESLKKYGIIVINDSNLIYAYKPNEERRLDVFFSTVIQKAVLKKFVIARLPVDKTDFEEFYRNVMINKKLGHKFVNLTEYFIYLNEELKTERENALKQEQQKEKKQGEKKKNVKAPQQKKDNIKKKDMKKK